MLEAARFWLKTIDMVKPLVLFIFVVSQLLVARNSSS